MRKNGNKGLLKASQSRGHPTRLQNGNEIVARSGLYSLDSKMGVKRKRARRSEKEPEPYGKMIEARWGGASLKYRQ